MTALRSLPILLAQLFALLALALAAASDASRHEKAWSVLDRIPSFATESYNATGAEPSFLNAESRILQGLPVSDMSKTSKTDDTDDDTESSVHLSTTDDGASYLNKTQILPPEQDQPRTWPATVLVMFIVLAAILLGMTAYNNYRKKSQYQDVPTTSLIV